MLNTGPHSCIWGGGLQLSSAGTGLAVCSTVPEVLATFILVLFNTYRLVYSGKSLQHFNAGDRAIADVAVCPLVRECCSFIKVFVNSQIPLHQFPRTKSVTSRRGKKSAVQWPGPSSCGRQQRLSEITTEPIKNLGSLGKIWGGAVPHGPNIEPPLLLCLLCRVVSFPRFRYSDLLPTSWHLSRLRGSYGETCVMDFGRNSNVHVRCVGHGVGCFRGIY